MKKATRKFYRFLGWFFSIIIAAGSLSGCEGASTKYGPPPSTLPTTQTKVTDKASKPIALRDFQADKSSMNKALINEDKHD